MKRTIHIAGKLEPFFGTLDENVRLLEDSLRVRTHLHDSKLTIEGEQHAVAQAVRHRGGIQSRHAQRQGTDQRRSEVADLRRDWTRPKNRRAECSNTARLRAFGKKSVVPRNAAQRHYMEADRNITT